MGTSLDNPIGRTGYKVAALVLSKLRKTEIGVEFQRLQGLSRTQAWLQVGGVIGGLFALALLAASLGWVGLAIYFISVVLLFR